MNYVLVASTTFNVDFTFTYNINEFKGFLEDWIADFELGWGSPSTTSFLLAFTSPSSCPPLPSLVPCDIFSNRDLTGGQCFSNRRGGALDPALLQPPWPWSFPAPWPFPEAQNSRKNEQILRESNKK